jgi:predicted transcriptional regulator
MMKTPKTYTLTKAEIQIMNILWEMPEGGCVHDIIEHYEEPKPAYTTISTFLKILLNKGFVDYRKLSGKTHTYYPLISREAYTGQVMKDVKESFFGGSGSSMVKFFAQNEKLTENDIKELLEIIQGNENK